MTSFVTKRNLGLSAATLWGLLRLRLAVDSTTSSVVVFLHLGKKSWIIFVVDSQDTQDEKESKKSREEEEQGFAQRRDKQWFILSRTSWFWDWTWQAP
jgi:hypothetical protein